MFIESAQQVLMDHGFTLREADYCRKAVVKKYPSERLFRLMFLTGGGNLVLWNAITSTFKNGVPRSHYIAYQSIKNGVFV